MSRTKIPSRPGIRAAFTLVHLPGEVTLLRDLDGDVSVTNDAEAVVAYVIHHYGPRRILYRDTDGRWDELRHDGEHFTGFFPISDVERSNRGLE
jgi:hypothetical protein